MLHYRTLRAALLIVNVVRYNIAVVRYNIAVVRYNMHAVRYNIAVVSYNIAVVSYNIAVVRYNIAVVRYNIAVVRYNMRRGANRSLFLRGFSGASVSSTGWSCTSPPPFHTGSTQGYSKGPSG
jgi:hypothetical protein